MKKTVKLIYSPSAYYIEKGLVNKYCNSFIINKKQRASLGSVF